VPIGTVTSQDEGWTPTEQRIREQKLRQFTSTDGPKGNSKEYRDSYDRIFGKTSNKTYHYDGNNLYKCELCDRLFNENDIKIHVHKNL
jgi:hypothetical protein